LPKPHDPTLQPKLCQRACKANAKEKLFLKNFQRFQKTKHTTNDRKRQHKNGCKERQSITTG